MPVKAAEPEGANMLDTGLREFPPFSTMQNEAVFEACVVILCL